MFLNKNYILANEVVQKGNIHIANISILIKNLSSLDEPPFIKMNSLTFLNKNSSLLPNNIQNIISSNEFTDLSDKLPCNYVRSEYGITEKELIESEVVVDKIEICDKKFYVFNQDFIKKVKRKILYVLNKKETEECLKKKQIEGFIQLRPNKFLTWY